MRRQALNVGIMRCSRSLQVVVGAAQVVGVPGGIAIPVKLRLLHLRLQHAKCRNGRWAQRTCSAPCRPLLRRRIEPFDEIWVGMPIIVLAQPKTLDYYRCGTPSRSHSAPTDFPLRSDLASLNVSVQGRWHKERGARHDRLIPSGSCSSSWWFPQIRCFVAA